MAPLFLSHSQVLPFFFFFSSRRRHTRSDRDWSSDVCSSDLTFQTTQLFESMTVADNVRVGLAGEATGGIVGALLGLPTGRRRERDLRADAIRDRKSVV